MHLLLSIHMVSPPFRSQSCMQYAPNLDPLRPYLHLQKHPKRQINAIHGHLLHPQATNQPPASMPIRPRQKNNHHQPIALLLPQKSAEKTSRSCLWQLQTLRAGEA
ncbi:hypothetical protein HDV62DRAFT_347181 [Trichoderma sp. SZMC 28011]